MKTRILIGLFALPMALAAASAASLKGRHYPAEAKTFTAPESGLEVIQLTTHPADDCAPYFTSTSFVGDGLVIASRRTGDWNLFYVDLKTRELTQLTDGRGIAGQGATVCPATREVFYREGDKIKSVNLDTLEERTITSAPDGYNVGAALSVTDDGTMLAFSITEKIKLTTKTDVIYSDMDEHFRKHPWSAVMVGRSDGSDWHQVARQRNWISHTMISPTATGGGGIVLYCHEGRWDQVPQRLWLVNADGTNNRKLRPEELPALRIGHEFWLPDGMHVGYQVQYPGKTKGIGIADVRNGIFKEYPADFTDTHVQRSRDGRWFVGDGSAKEPYINLYELQDGRLHGRHLFRHDGSFAQQYWHPHPSFSPDDRFVLFTSNRAGNGDVYLIRLPVGNAPR